MYYQRAYKEENATTLPNVAFSQLRRKDIPPQVCSTWKISE
jgi:hypothetical protein